MIMQLNMTLSIAGNTNNLPNTIDISSPAKAETHIPWKEKKTQILYSFSDLPKILKSLGGELIFLLNGRACVEKAMWRSEQSVHKVGLACGSEPCGGDEGGGGGGEGKGKER